MAKIAISFQNLRLAEAFDDAPEREIVVGDAGGGRGAVGARAAGVIVGQADDGELREFALRFECFEFSRE